VSNNLSAISARSCGVKGGILANLNVLAGFGIVATTREQAVEALLTNETASFKSDPDACSTNWTLYATDSSVKLSCRREAKLAAEVGYTPEIPLGQPLRLESAPIPKECRASASIKGGDSTFPIGTRYIAMKGNIPRAAMEISYSDRAGCVAGSLPSTTILRRSVHASQFRNRSSIQTAANLLPVDEPGLDLVTNIVWDTEFHMDRPTKQTFTTARQPYDFTLTCSKCANDCVVRSDSASSTLTCDGVAAQDLRLDDLVLTGPFVMPDPSIFSDWKDWREANWAPLDIHVLDSGRLQLIRSGEARGAIVYPAPVDARGFCSIDLELDSVNELTVSVGLRKGSYVWESPARTVGLARSLAHFELKDSLFKSNQDGWESRNYSLPDGIVFDSMYVLFDKLSAAQIRRVTIRRCHL
jgi:hypothetical protein